MYVEFFYNFLTLTNFDSLEPNLVQKQYLFASILHYLKINVL